MRRQITGSVRAGERTIRVADRIVRIDNPVVNMPKHVVELEHAARQTLATGDRNVYRLAVKKWEGTISRLGATAGGDFSVRAATEQLVTDLRNAKVTQIENIVDRWTLDRARSQARTIARTETVDGYRDQYRRQMNKQPYVVGYRWLLSPRHPKADVCDILASQDLDGLGAGGYLPEGVPDTPHANDMCTQVAIMDSDHFKRERAQIEGTEAPPKPWLSGKKQNGTDWLKTQPEGYQKQLLGPTRHKAMQQGRAVLDKGGKPIPVWKVQGLTRPPPRALGPAVAARGLVRRDARRQVRPFPRVRPSAR